MSQTYFAILTAVGEAKLANAAALGVPLQLTVMAVGDGNGNLPVPNRLQTALVRQVYQAPINELKIDPVNASQIIAELVIPETEGGYWLREMGLKDAAGDLIAVANCPPSYKPEMAEGSGRTQVLRMVLIVSSTAAVQLKIDPSVVLATRAYADSLIAVHMAAADPHPQYKTEVATQAEAEVGANNVKRMTPLRVKQAIEAQVDGISGLVSNLRASATGTNPNVAISTDSICVQSSAGKKKVLNNVNLTINSATLGANGLDAGVLAANTWYRKWVLWNPETDERCGLLSLSTDPVLPAGFTHKARTGWVRTDGTANKFPLSFAQFGKSVFYKVVPGSNVTRYPAVVAGVQGNTGTPTWVSASLTNAIPPTASIVHYNAFFEGVGASMIFAPNNSFGSVDSITNVPPLMFRTYTANNSFSSCFSLLRESDNAFYASGGTESGVNVIGWEDGL